MKKRISLAHPFSTNSLGTFQFQCTLERNISIEIFYHFPDFSKLKKSKLVIVLTGKQRNAAAYRKYWIEQSKMHNFFVIVPHFKNDLFPGVSFYNLGNLMENKVRIVPEKNWTFSLLPKLFKYLKKHLSLPQKGYYLFGHSAGAQFVHRFLLFKPDNKVIKAIAANAGWYTIPDFNIAFPYGLKNSPFQKDKLQKVFSQQFLIALGKEDKDAQSPNLRHTIEAELQGNNRHERGKYFFEQSQKICHSHQYPFEWQVLEIENIGHRPSKIIPATASFFLEK